MNPGKFGMAEIQERKTLPQTTGRSKRRVSFLIGVVVLLCLAGVGTVRWFSRTKPTEENSVRAAAITATVIHPGKASITIPELPGRTQAYTDAPIFAQTSGYLKKWYFDIGAKVKAGQVLAEIDTPEDGEIIGQTDRPLNKDT